MAPSTDDRILDSPGKPPSGVVVAFVDAVNRQDWRAVEALVATTFIRHSDAGGRIEGRDGLIAFLQGEYVTFPDAYDSLSARLGSV